MSISPTGNILVTGGAGFIGSAFVNQVASKGCKAVVLDKLTYAGHTDNLADVKKGGYELVVGDIGNGALVRRILKEHNITSVFNFAAESHVDNSIKGPKTFLDTNVMGVYELLQASFEHYQQLTDKLKPNFRFVQVSTDEVYGSLGSDEAAFTEESQFQPNSPYSATKAAGDHLVRAWHHTFGLPVMTTHCSNNYGPRQHPEKLIPTMILKALSGEKLPIYGDGSNIRDWIYVDDHASGVWLTYEKGEVGETYNFGGRAQIDNLTLVKQLCAHLDAKKPREDGASYSEQISFVTDRPGHDQRYAIDDAKAEVTLGFKTSVSHEEGLKKTVDWYLANGAWCETMGKKAA